jgi:hypothetical protein
MNTISIGAAKLLLTVLCCTDGVCVCVCVCVCVRAFWVGPMLWVIECTDRVRVLVWATDVASQTVVYVRVL